VIVIPGHHYHWGHRGQIEQSPIHDLFAARTGRGGVEDVPGDNHQIDCFAAGQTSDFRKDLTMLVVSGTAADTAADVPVSSVKDLHG
jgi:hypothetical protein